MSLSYVTDFAMAHVGGVFDGGVLDGGAPATLAFLHQVGPVGLVVILIIALLIFGKRLPDVARSMGKGIVEFKKGLRGVEDEIDRAADQPAKTGASKPNAGPPGASGAPMDRES